MKTTKKILRFALLTVLIFSCCANVYSQGNIGIGITSPHASAQVDITAAGKGLLIPRITTSQLGSIVNPAKGLMVYDTVANQLLVNMGTESIPAWQTIVAKSGWALNGNAGTDTSVNFIGTTDTRPLVFRVNNQRFGRLDQNRRNIAFGRSAGLNATGTDNIYMGEEAGVNITSGAGNIFMGARTGSSLTSSTSNIFIGHEAGMEAVNETGGGGDIFIGYQAGKFHQKFQDNFVDGNIYIGYQSGYLDTAGHLNTFVGLQTGVNLQSGSHNSFYGYQSGYSNTSGNSNVFTGYRAGFNNSTGSENIFIGRSAGFNNYSGSNNIYIGMHAGLGQSSSFSSSNNTFVGDSTGFSIISASSNSFFGRKAGFNTAAGNGNTFVGDSAGYFNNIGNNNTAAGQYATMAFANISNATAIGYRALVATGNALVLGSVNGVNGATASVNVGIGLNVPLRPLHVASSGITGVTPHSDAIIVAERNGDDGYITILTDSDQSSALVFGNQNSSSDGGIYYNTTGNSYDLRFRTNGNATYMAIDSTGHVGIGTVTPAYGLHVANNLGSDGFIRGVVVDATNTGTTGEATISFRNAGTGGTGPKYFIVGLNQGRNLNFAYGNTFNAGSTLMTLDSTGRLGIGTTTPVEKLEIAGNVKLNGEVNNIPTGSANLLPLCYGVIAPTGSINSATDNITSSTKTATGVYEIAIAGESYSTGAYMTIVTPINGSSARTTTTSSSGTSLMVRTFDASSGVPIDCGFSFMVYKQ